MKKRKQNNRGTHRVPCAFRQTTSDQIDEVTSSILAISARKHSTSSLSQSFDLVRRQTVTNQLRPCAISKRLRLQTEARPAFSFMGWAFCFYQRPRCVFDEHDAICAPGRSVPKAKEVGNSKPSRFVLLAVVSSRGILLPPHACHLCQRWSLCGEII